MDPWADSSVTWSPQESTRPKSPSPVPDVSGSTYAGGPVDPWAEPSSSSNIPVLPTQRKHSNSSQDYSREARSGSVSDFDPWGGNSAPVAPLSTAFRSSESDEGDANTAEKVKSTELHSEEQSHSRHSEEGLRNIIATPEERDIEPAVVDDDDPWGSGAAARRIKVQQDAESAAQRMAILRLQEEAKGKQFDDAGNEIDAKPEEPTAEETKEGNATQLTTETPVVASGWRSLFNRSAVKPSTGEENKEAKEIPKLDTSVAAKESPRSSTALAAPRLWQAPTILGSHTRSTSSSSRNESLKEPTTPPIKGPGWEVTTKKQQGSGGGGGLIQSLFGSTATNDDDKVTITSKQKETKTSGLNRFGRGLQPPPVVSAADDEDDSFETEETGIEWEAGNVFDGKVKSIDLLSDQADAKPAESTVGKLLGRWRGKEAPGKTDGEDLSKADMAWLENVGATNTGAIQGKKEGKISGEDDTDWLAFMNQQNDNNTASSSIAPEARSNSDRFRISSTSKGTVNRKIPSLAPPPPPPNTSVSSGHRTTSPFSFRGPGTLSASRLASTAAGRSTNTQDTLGEFLDETPAPNEGYRDDVVDNDAALLQSRSGQPPKKNSSFLRGLQGTSRGSRYDYDEDDVDSHEESWTAFSDQDRSIGSSSYQDKERRQTVSPPIVSSANIIRSKSGSSSTPVTMRSNNGILPPPPKKSNSPSWNRNAPLLPPPGRPQSTDQVKQQTSQVVLQPSKPKTLSQGKTLTSDDLSFFESL